MAQRSSLYVLEMSTRTATCMASGQRAAWTTCSTAAIESSPGELAVDGGGLELRRHVGEEVRHVQIEQEYH
jgi:hypothetical protein